MGFSWFLMILSAVNFVLGVFFAKSDQASVKIVLDSAVFVGWAIFIHLKEEARSRRKEQT